MLRVRRSFTSIKALPYVNIVRNNELIRQFQMPRRPMNGYCGEISLGAAVNDVGLLHVPDLVIRSYVRRGQCRKIAKGSS